MNRLRLGGLADGAAQRGRGHHRSLTASTLLILLGTLSGAGVLALIAAAGSAPSARADALCDQMRAQYGANWPCISVPTYTPPPTQNTRPPTIGPGADNAGSGPGIAGNPGPGPGDGNSIPIVPVPGQSSTPQSGPPPSASVAESTAPTPDRGAPAVGDNRTAARPTAPATSDASSHASRTAQPLTSPSTAARLSEDSRAQVLLDPNSSDRDSTVPLGAWVLAGAAALAISHPRARTLHERTGTGRHDGGAGSMRSWSLLQRGGSHRAQIGPTRLVLINDSTSPRDYRFAMNVPPGGTTRINPDGSATVYDRNGNPIRSVARPWAYDSAGRPQKTWYTVADNGDLIQHVAPADNALYPILADPTDNLCTPQDPDGNGIDGFQQPQQSQTSTATTAPDGSVVTTTQDGHGGTITSTSTPVPASGGSVDTSIANADGTTTQTRSVPDGNGGVTTWTANPDGSNSIAYPDGTVYTEPGTSGNGYSQSTPTGDGGVDTEYTSPDGGQYTSHSTTNYDGSIHTETDTPEGHVSSDSAVTGDQGNIITQATTPQGDTVMTRSDPDPDGTINTHRIVAVTTDEQGRTIYVHDDGTAYIPNVGDGTSAEVTAGADGSKVIWFSDGTRSVIDKDGNQTLFDKYGTPMMTAAANAAPKLLTGQAVSQGSKLASNIAVSMAIAGWLDNNPQVANASMKTFDYAVRFGKLAPAVAAPVGMYMDIKNGIEPGKAVTVGALSAGATIATAALLGPGLVPVVIAAGVGAGVYYGGKWAYDKLPDGVTNGINSGVKAVGSGITSVWKSIF